MTYPEDSEIVTISGTRFYLAFGLYPKYIQCGQQVDSIICTLKLVDRSGIALSNVEINLEKLVAYIGLVESRCAEDPLSLVFAGNNLISGNLAANGDEEGDYIVFRFRGLIFNERGTYRLGVSIFDLSHLIQEPG
ncbi:hypothetical protein BB560_005140 [Smittium megazygosporum]|uniref:Velvet domain-containing protein n=1 Tax=Smittium megazygosporum TaxID=133381 RepID=A0A2T9Z7H2_9FUNG|nr:hypothetical protein BB560_005140 [Smittium megazygosporum]